MSDTTTLYEGFWIDRTASPWDPWRYMHTGRDMITFLMTSIVAASITLAGPYLLRLFGSFLDWLTGYSASQGHRKPDHMPNESTHLLDGGDNRDNAAAADNHTDVLVDPEIQHAGPPVGQHRDYERAGENIWHWAIVPMYRLMTGGTLRDKEWSGIYPLTFVTTSLFAVLAATFVANQFSAKIASQTAGLSSAQTCGRYRFNTSLGAQKDFPRNTKKEQRAAQYAQGCYDLSTRLDDSFSCDVFFQRNIRNHSHTGRLCPFASPDICVDPVGAIELWTDLVPAKDLGINTAESYGFRRRSTCSPITMLDKYIEERVDEDNTTAYHYKYGSVDWGDYIDNSTYDTSGDPWTFPVSQYSLDVRFYSGISPNRSFWVPIPELLPINTTASVTIMFIRSLHLWYYKPSNDPIFRAVGPAKSNPQWYYNDNPRARPLACAETTDLCYPDETNCWPMSDDPPRSIASDPSYGLMRWALDNSNAYDSIKQRLGSALIANDHIGGYFSTGLPDDQWELEARRIFATSLARIQWDLWSMATGEDADQADYYDATPKKAKNKLCHRYKFKKVGYFTINAATFFGIILVSALVFLLTRQTPRRFQYPKGEEFRGQITAETLARRLQSLVSCFKTAGRSQSKKQRVPSQNTAASYENTQASVGASNEPPDVSQTGGEQATGMNQSTDQPEHASPSVDESGGRIQNQGVDEVDSSAAQQGATESDDHSSANAFRVEGGDATSLFSIGSGDEPSTQGNHEVPDPLPARAFHS